MIRHIRSLLVIFISASAVASADLPKKISDAPPIQVAFQKIPLISAVEEIARQANLSWGTADDTRSDFWQQSVTYTGTEAPSAIFRLFSKQYGLAVIPSKTEPEFVTFTDVANPRAAAQRIYSIDGVLRERLSSQFNEPPELKIDDWLAGLKERILIRDENGKLMRQPEPKLMYSDFPNLLVVHGSDEQQAAVERYLDVEDRMPRQFSLFMTRENGEHVLGPIMIVEGSHVAANSSHRVIDGKSAPSHITRFYARLITAGPEATAVARVVGTFAFDADSPAGAQFDIAAMANGPGTITDQAGRKYRLYTREERVGGKISHSPKA